MSKTELVREFVNWKTFNDIFRGHNSKDGTNEGFQSALNYARNTWTTDLHAWKNLQELFKETFIGYFPVNPFDEKARWHYLPGTHPQDMIDGLGWAGGFHHGILFEMLVNARHANRRLLMSSDHRGNNQAFGAYKSGKNKSLARLETQLIEKGMTPEEIEPILARHEAVARVLEHEIIDGKLSSISVPLGV